MDQVLLRRPWRLLRTRLPWTSLVYLALIVLAGWLALLAAATIVLLPAWARAWAGLERRAVTLAGHPRIPAPPRPPRTTSRELAHALLTVLAAPVGTTAAAVIVGTGLATLGAPAWIALGHPVTIAGLQIDTPTEQGVAFLVGLLWTGLVLWVCTLAATTFAHLSTIVLSPGTEELRHRAEVLATAALKAQDDLTLERRELERRLHDGAQLHLSVAATHLGLLELDLNHLPTDTRTTLLADVTTIRDHLDAAAHDIRDIATGLIPRTLTDEGLGPALHELTAVLPLDVEVDVDLPRLDEPVETGIYLTCSEAITNTLKHAHATTLNIHLRAHQRDLILVIIDDGRGGADGDGGGILGMQARAASLGGRLDLTSPDGGPTTLTLHLPGILNP